MSVSETRAGLIERAIVCGARNRQSQALKMNIKLMQTVIPELKPKAQSRAASTIQNLESQLQEATNAV